MTLTKAPASTDTPVQAAAKDWLDARRTETEANATAKAANKIRTAAAKVLDDLLGEGGIVAVNDGGFKRYRFTVTRSTSTAYSQVLADLKVLHPNLAGEIDRLVKAHTKPVEKPALKAENGI